MSAGVSTSGTSQLASPPAVNGSRGSSLEARHIRNPSRTTTRRGPPPGRLLVNDWPRVTMCDSTGGPATATTAPDRNPDVAPCGPGPKNPADCGDSQPLPHPARQGSSQPTRPRPRAEHSPARQESFRLLLADSRRIREHCGPQPAAVRRPPVQRTGQKIDRHGNTESEQCGADIAG